DQHPGSNSRMLCGNGRREHHMPGVRQHDFGPARGVRTVPAKGRAFPSGV
ncbi:MAG: hypothetical protein AVDCRST_MAG43-1820, partial [uncultured Thermomicrobiales bacterium]